MPNFLSQFLRPVGLDPSQGYDTAAAGAKDAQAQDAKLSDLQWNRQMQGLGQAQGYTGQLQSLYNSIYSPGGGKAAPGGMQSPSGPGGAAPGGNMLMGPPPPASAPAGGPGSLKNLSPAYQIYEHWTKPALGVADELGNAASGGLLNKGISAIKGLF